MSFTSPPELLTGITDAAIIPFAAAVFVAIGKIKDRDYLLLWRLLLAAMSVSGVGGFIAHGVVYPDSAYNGVWIPLQIVMLATVAVFLYIAVYDLCGRVPKKVFFIAVSSAFLLVSALTAVLQLSGVDSFDIFLYTAAVCVGSGAVIYPILIFSGKRYAVYLLAGIAVQAVGILPRLLGLQSVIAIGDFDGNSIYHTAAAISLIVFCVGILKRDKELN